MQWQSSPYALALILTAVAAGIVVLLAWRRRPAPGAWPTVFLMLAVAEWSLAYALELGSANLGAQVFWAKVQYLGIVSVPVMWLVLAVEYTGLGRWLTRRNLILLAIVPIATLLLAWTNDLHGLIWTQVSQATVDSYLVLDLAYGAVFWVHLAFAYLMLLAGTIRFLQVLVRSPQLYRGQAGAVLVGVLTPWLGNALYVSGLSPFPSLDLTPLAFTVSGLALAWAIFHFRLLDFVPVARESVIRGLGDSVIVLDAQNRIVDLNPTAERLIGRSTVEVLGQPVDRALPGGLGAAEQYQAATEMHSEIVLGEAESQRIYDFRISPLRDRRGRLIGRVLVLHDVSEHKWTEEALRRRAVQLRTAAEVARDSTALRSLEDLLNRTVTMIRERFGFYHAGIFLVEGAGQDAYAVLKAATGEAGRRMLERGHRLKVGGEGIVGYVTDVGEPRVALDVGKDAAFFDNPDLPETRSEVALPLRARGEIIGALDVQSVEPDAFSQEDVEVLQILADQVAVAISNMRLFQQAQESLEAERRAYGELSQEAWRELVQTRGGLEQRYDPYKILPADGRWREEMVRAVQETRMVSGQDGSAATVAIPLKVRDRVVGVLDAHKPADAGNWTEDELNLLQALVEQLGVAVESARLYGDTRRRAAQDRLISQVTMRMRESLDVRRVLETTADELYEALGLDKVVIRLTDGEESRSS
jgi:PAS domain S-box-containing protein